MLKGSLVLAVGWCGAVVLAADGPVRKAYSARAGQTGVLSDTLVESFQTERLNGELRTYFEATFEPLEPSPSVAGFPFRVTMGLYESKSVAGRMVARRLNGTGNVYVLDSDGRVVARQEMSLAKLCPS